MIIFPAPYWLCQQAKGIPVGNDRGVGKQTAELEVGVITAQAAGTDIIWSRKGIRRKQ